MITDEHHPEMQKATHNLARLLRSVLGRTLNDRSIYEMNKIIKDHRLTLRLRGVDFPELTAMYLPSKGIIKLLRADLDSIGVREAVISTIAEFPDIDLKEVAQAISLAWPDVKQVALLDEAEFIGQKLEQRVN